MIIGRKKEQGELQGLLEKEESQFCAVYGRRRVGKTYLIRETFNYQFCFHICLWLLKAHSLRRGLVFLIFTSAGGLPCARPNRISQG